MFDLFSCRLSEELNMSRVSGTGSSPSLSSGSAGGDGVASRVVSWAVCFERLMEDPVGVRYFTVRTSGFCPCDGGFRVPLHQTSTRAFIEVHKIKDVGDQLHV